MLDFVAEAAVLVGLLTYARSRGGENERTEPEKKEPATGSRAQSRGPSANAKTAGRSASPRQTAAAPPPESASRPTVLDEAADAAQKAWGKLSGWISSAVSKASPERAQVDPAARAPSAREDRKPPNPTGRSLWGETPRYGTTRPGPATPASTSQPSTGGASAAAPTRTGVPANGSQAAAAPPIHIPREETKRATDASGSSPAQDEGAQTVRAAAGGPPATIRDPVCKLELPWSRAVSLRVGSETIYFCSESCRQVYAKGLEHG